MASSDEDSMLADSPGSADFLPLEDYEPGATNEEGAAYSQLPFAASQGGIVIKDDRITVHNTSGANRFTHPSVPSTSRGDIVVKDDRMLAHAHSPDFELMEAKPITDFSSEIEAKNKVIHSLTQQLKQVKRQTSRMSNGSRDSTDGHSSSDTRMLSPVMGQQPRPSSALSASSCHQQNYAAAAVGKRQNSSEMETSNSTDAEKLAGYSDGERIRKLVMEIESLTDLNNKHEETIEEQNSKIEQMSKDLDVALNLKEDLQRLYDESEARCSKTQEENDNVRTIIVQLKHQLETERRHVFEAEAENDQLRKEQLALKNRCKSAERTLETLRSDKEEMQQKLVQSTAEKLTPVGGEKEVERLAHMVELLYNELQETALVVKRQNEHIKHLKNQMSRPAQPSASSGFASSLGAPQTTYRIRGPTPSTSSGAVITVPTDTDTARVPEAIGFTQSFDNQPSVNRSASQSTAQSTTGGINMLYAQPVPPPTSNTVPPHRRNIVVSTEPSEDDIYGEASATNVLNNLSNYRRKPGGSFDLDNFEESLRSAQSQSVTTTHPARPSSSSSSRYVGMRPVEQADDHADSLKICPVCNSTQPPGTTVDEFQAHVVSCLGQEDVVGPVYPPTTSQPRYTSDMICPVCQALFPPDSPQAEFEQHVNGHFESDFTMLGSSDDFATPQ